MFEVCKRKFIKYEKHRVYCIILAFKSGVKDIKFRNKN